jgi:mannose-6-phosphate isomerase-like protein (cupin superfamily)
MNDPNRIGRDAFVVKSEDAPTKEIQFDRGYAIQLVDPGTGSERLDMHVNVLRPGAAVGPYHLHTEVENVYYILEGKVRIVLDGVAYEPSPGSAVFIPSGVPHSATNIGDSEARLLEIYAPPNRDFVWVSEDGGEV